MTSGVSWSLGRDYTNMVIVDAAMSTIGDATVPHALKPAIAIAGDSRYC